MPPSEGYIAVSDEKAKSLVIELGRKILEVELHSLNARQIQITESSGKTKAFRIKTICSINLCNCSKSKIFMLSTCDKAFLLGIHTRES